MVLKVVGRGVNVLVTIDIRGNFGDFGSAHVVDVFYCWQSGSGGADIC